MIFWGRDDFSVICTLSPMGLRAAALPISTTLGHFPPSLRSCCHRSLALAASARSSRKLPTPLLRPRNIGFSPKQPSPIPMTLPSHPHSSSSSSSSSSLTGPPITDSGAKMNPPSAIGQYDLLIVGPGVLGRIVAELWRKDHSGCQIFGQTMTADHHGELSGIGIIPSLRGVNMTNKFPNVIFCAPPYRSQDYPGDLRLAASSWNGEGCFLFTSSTAVYDCSDNGSCDEESPIVPIGRNPRTDALLNAEKEVLEVGGCVLRLVGLYKEDKGPHVYWLDKGTVALRPDHILNLIHYEDAALLATAIMKKKFRQRIFLGCDNHPLSRQEIMDYVHRSGKLSKKFVGFTGADDPLGKRLDNSKTRAEVGWEPKYASFAQFLSLKD